MTKILVIAGHGKKRNGVDDSGATGIISKGEYRYFVEDFFPAMRKHLPSGYNIVFYTAHNVYDYGDLIALANKQGKDTVVVEMHYDAGVTSASGGHVIVHSAYEPDSLDLALRDVIKKHIGIRYSHKGHLGISGRDNLGNVNRAKSGNINYRLVELGFGTNPNDSSKMIKSINVIAKDFVQALIGKVSTVPSKPKPKPVTSTKKTTAQIVDEVIANKWGSGDERKTRLSNAGYNYSTIQDGVNKKLGGTVKPKLKTTSTIVSEVLAGVWGNDPERSTKLKKAGYNPTTIQNAVNKKSGGRIVNPMKNNATIVNEVIRGEWGNGVERNDKLKKAGYNPTTIQNGVNKKLK